MVAKQAAKASPGERQKDPSQSKKFAPWDDPDATPYIVFENVTKRFGTFTAVDDISLTVYQREFFSLLGPSGCGKTTLLRMLAGFETPTSGRILVDGQDISHVPPYRRPVNMMFQSYALFPHMSVADNIAFGLKQDKMPKAEIAERVADMLRLVKLEPFARRKPHQLSGGQRQRVALARSLAKRPKVLLLDEPLGALDKKLREETQFELMDIQESLGMTFMIVTHDQEEAMTVSDRIAVMNLGVLVQVSTPPHMYEYPKSRYVADFIGDINILDAEIVSSDQGVVTLKTEDAGLVTVNQALDVAPGTPAFIAIRPEKMQVVERDAANCVSGEVWDIAYLGDLSIYHVKLPSGAVVKASQTNVTRLVERQITWEDQISLAFSPDAATVLLD